MLPRLWLYAVLGCLVSPLQFGFFDCSGLRALSFVAGAVTVTTALTVADGVYHTTRTSRPAATRLVQGAAIGVGGAAAVLGMAYCTIITHICG